MAEQSDFPRRLAELRRAAGLTQQALADALGVSRPRVAEWEAGRRVPLWTTACALADALGVGVGELRG